MGFVRPVHPKPCKLRGMGGEGRSDRQLRAFTTVCPFKYRIGEEPAPDRRGPQLIAVRSVVSYVQGGERILSDGQSPVPGRKLH